MAVKDGAQGLLRLVAMVTVLATVLLGFGLMLKLAALARSE